MWDERLWKIIIENCWKEVSLNGEALILGEGKMKKFLYELSMFLPHTERAVLPNSCLSIRFLSWFFLSTQQAGLLLTCN